jgi:hypothetical protein
MSETMGRLLAAGQRAEVFEWGCRVVKLGRSTGSKQVIFREAAISAAAEALGLHVPAVWSVQQIDGRWGIVFDRMSGVSFAEQMLGDPAAIPQRLQILVRVHAGIRAHVVDQFSSLKGWLTTRIARTIASRRAATADLAEWPQGYGRRRLPVPRRFSPQKRSGRGVAAHGDRLAQCLLR